MPVWIRQFILPESDDSFECQEGPLPSRHLGPLEKINLLIGPNNSGKSRFLRALCKTKTPRFVPSFEIDQFNRLKTEALKEFQGLLPNYISDLGGIKASLAALPDYSNMSADDEFLKPFETLSRSIAQTSINGLNISYSKGFVGGNPSGVVPAVKDFGNRLQASLSGLSAGLPKKIEFDRVYIPSLRGLRPFVNKSDVYKERTDSDYFGGHEGIRVITGLSLYEELKSLLLGTLQDRRRVAAFQNYLSKTFFDDQDVALIPRANRDVLYVKIGAEEEQPIFNLGDGIQMLIVITFSIFSSSPDKSTLLFIEEPELYLHPGLQRTLISSLASFENVQCFIATHSNHILDLTADRNDISVFSVKKELQDGSADERRPRCVVQNLSNGDSSALNLLGVRNSSVFLSNCTIWVEGITDRRYFRHFLKLYQNTLPLPQRFKEDLHFSFVEYGGSNITHWSFLDEIDDSIVVERLCGKLLLIADQDDSELKRERHRKLEKRLGSRFILLNRREVENLLAPEVIRSVVAHYEGNTDSMAEFDYPAYANAYLGDFIETKLTKGLKRRGGYKATSGTLRDKVLFCEKALAHMREYASLSDDAKVIAVAIYEFIKLHNPR